MALAAHQRVHQPPRGAEGELEPRLPPRHRRLMKERGERKLSLLTPSPTLPQSAAALQSLP